MSRVDWRQMRDENKNIFRNMCQIFLGRSQNTQRKKEANRHLFGVSGRVQAHLVNHNSELTHVQQMNILILGVSAVTQKIN